MNVENPVTIEMDFREVSSRIAQILKDNYGVNIVKRALSAGDYLIDSRIAVERKTIRDFAHSIVDGRLFTQAARMKRSFEASFLIIEGEAIDEAGIDIHPSAVKGAMVSLAISWRVPVFFSKNIAETAFYLWQVASQQVAKREELACRPGRRPKRFRRRQLYIVEGLPQVGPKLAQRLLDHFGSIEKIMTASEKELLKVPGLGKRKAQIIRNVVSAGVRRDDEDIN